MKIILWSQTALLALIPAVMYVIYSMRRLDTRRRLLFETLLTLGLDHAYVRIKHGQHYPDWCKLPPVRRSVELEFSYFNPDFKAETSHADYAWPVALMTALSGMGWYFALSRFYPDAGTAQFNKLIPATFVWGFVSAYFASLLLIIDEFRKYSLMPSSYYSMVYRLLFSSTAGFLLGQRFPDTLAPLVAFGIGLFPVEKIANVITEKVSHLLNINKIEGELGEDLKAIQGLEDTRNRRKLIDIGITSVQALATADPLMLFFQTLLPMRTVVDLIDKAILYLYIGDKVKVLRLHGINGVIELVALVKLIDRRPAYAGGEAFGGAAGFSKCFRHIDGQQLFEKVAEVLGQSVNELKAFIFNMYYDPVVQFIYEVWGSYQRVRPSEESEQPSLMLQEIECMYKQEIPLFNGSKLMGKSECEAKNPSIVHSYQCKSADPLKVREFYKDNLCQKGWQLVKENTNGSAWEIRFQLNDYSFSIVHCGPKKCGNYSLSLQKLIVPESTASVTTPAHNSPPGENGSPTPLPAVLCENKRL